MSVVLSSETELKKSDVPDLEQCEEQRCCTSSRRESTATCTSYLLFMLSAGFFMREYSDADFSAILTVSSAVQFFGFTLLLHKVKIRHTCAGLSARSLELYALFFITRLIATCNRNGYVPVDRSGRSVYQMLDFASFLLVLQLLYCIHKTHKYSYQEEQDSLPTFPLIPPCLVLGYFIHADLNRSPLFDTIWATSTNIDTVAMLPQLWMMTKIGGVVEGCTSHFVAAIVASRALALSFWCTAYKDLSGAGSDLAGKQIVLANVLQCLLSADFLYYYCRARYAGKRMHLPSSPGQPETSRSAMDI